MYSFITTLITLTPVLHLIHAAPTNPSELFALRTTSRQPRFNHLCVTPHHIGAGINDAILTSCHPDNSISDKTPTETSNIRSPKIFYANGSTIASAVFAPDHFSHFLAPQMASYDSWYQTYINAGNIYNEGNPTPTEFSYDEKEGYLADGQYGFLACRWAHKGAVELFVLSEPGRNKSQLLETCGFVSLHRYFEAGDA